MEGVGFSDVEMFARKSSQQGARREARRKRLVREIMKKKKEDAVIQLGWSKERFRRKMAKLEARWGHYREVMAAFRSIINQEATRVWGKGKDKVKRKVAHLVGRWGRPAPTRVGEWRGC